MHSLSTECTQDSPEPAQSLGHDWLCASYSGSGEKEMNHRKLRQGTWAQGRLVDIRFLLENCVHLEGLLFYTNWQDPGKE